MLDKPRRTPLRCGPVLETIRFIEPNLKDATLKLHSKSPVTRLPRCWTLLRALAPRHGGRDASVICVGFTADVNEQPVARAFDEGGLSP
jgi:hypothetical protein